MNRSSKHMRRNGARDEETLDAVGADGAHGAGARWFFHPFDRHLDATLWHSSMTASMNAVERFPVDVLDEQAVDLHDVGGRSR